MDDVRSRLREQRMVLLKEPRGAVHLDRDTLVLLLADASDAIAEAVAEQLRPPREITLNDKDLAFWWSTVNMGQLRRYPIGTIERLVAALIEAVRERPVETHKRMNESRHRWIDAVKGALGQRWNGSAEDAKEQLTELGIYAAGMLEAGETSGPAAAQRWGDAVEGFRELQEKIREKQNG
jgi:hypothetical protein